MTVLRNALSHLWYGERVSGDEIIALVLLGAMLISSAHLMTMLVTRWGDRHLAFKSFLASLMVHAVCLVTMQVFDPLALTPPTYAEAPPPPPEVLAEVLIESDDDVLSNEAGNTALIPDQPVQPDIDLTRSTHDARNMQPTEVEREEKEVLDSLDVDAKDISQFESPDRPEQAIRVDDAAEGIQSESADSVKAEVETLVEASTADVFTPRLERVRTERGDVFVNRRPRERSMTQGSVIDIDTNIRIEDQSLNVAMSESPTAIRIPVAEVDEGIQRRAAPINSPTPMDDAGVSRDLPEEATMTARSFESRLPRRTRSMRTFDEGRRAVRRTSQMPQADLSLSEEYDEVRTGITSLNPTDALRSASTLVDTDVIEVRRRESRPSTYKLRNVEERRIAARKFGGTKESEAAVELSLRWLSNNQEVDGHFDAATYGAGQVNVDEQGVERNFAGRDSDAGLTALVTLSFLGAGYTHEEGKYAVNVDAALDWLISHQDEEGCLGANAGHYARMYCHAMATYALAEAMGMQQELVIGPVVDPGALNAGATVSQVSTAMSLPGLVPLPSVCMTDQINNYWADLTAFSMRKVDDIRLRTALLKAITYTISQQDVESGGWRYTAGQEGDVSMFGWQMMSLKSAEIAGIKVNPVVRKRMIEFLNSVRQGPSGGLFGYRRSVEGQEEKITPIMTAEALFCQQMLGYPRDSAASREAVEYMLQNRPRLAELNMYYWYYGTLAMYQYGGSEWDEWNSAVRDTLISEQRTDGRYTGSWDPKGPWGRYGGRLYSTALSTLTLEVYYRLLPLYRFSEQE